MKNYVIMGFLTLTFSGLIAQDTDNNTNSMPSLEDMIEVLDLQDLVDPDMLDKVKQLSAERQANPEIQFTNSLKVIEKIDPSLAGISDTWQNEETLNLFETLMIGITNYYSTSEEEQNRMLDSITRLATSVPESHTQLLTSMVDSFSRKLATHLEIIHGFVLSSHKEEINFLDQIKDELLEDDPEANVEEIEKYKTCLSDLDGKEKEGMSKYLSKFIELIENNSIKMEELDLSELDYSKEIKLSVSNIFKSQSSVLVDLMDDILIENECHIDLEDIVE